MLESCLSDQLGFPFGIAFPARGLGASRLVYIGDLYATLIGKRLSMFAGAMLGLTSCACSGGFAQQIPIHAISECR